MGDLMYVMPVDGLVVRFPETMAQLPLAGAWVPKDSYWLRRLADGSVREAVQPTTDEGVEAIKPPIKRRETGRHND